MHKYCDKNFLSHNFSPVKNSSFYNPKYLQISFPVQLQLHVFKNIIQANYLAGTTPHIPTLDSATE